MFIFTGNQLNNHGAHETKKDSLVFQKSNFETEACSPLSHGGLRLTF
jgi:hypothetical protein